MSIEQSIYTLNSAMTQLMRHIRLIDEQQQVGRARLSVLAVLHFGGNRSLSELAATEMVKRSTMHHIVKGLESDKLVKRDRDPVDARRQIVTLTGRGRAKIKSAHRARIAYLTELAAGLDPEDLEAAANALDALRNESWQRVLQ